MLEKVYLRFVYKRKNNKKKVKKEADRIIYFYGNIYFAEYTKNK